MEDYMNVLEGIDSYTKYVKNNPYVYAIQKLGIEVFLRYISSNNLNIEIGDIQNSMIDKLLLYWIPKHQRYLSEVEAYQVVYTIHDLYNYLLKSDDKVQEENAPALLDLYGEEYMRVYRIRNMLLKMTKDPVIATNPLVIDLNNYKTKKKKGGYVEMATTYEQAIFKVQDCKEGGQIILSKIYHDKQYKLLLEYPAYKYFKKGDLIHAIIKRKLFYVYWEIEELKSYYLPEALSYFIV
jgi:hypothetical protein